MAGDDLRLCTGGELWHGGRLCFHGQAGTNTLNSAVKLLKLPETFLTATGRRLAEERAAVMRRFLADLARDLGAREPGW